MTAAADALLASQIAYYRARAPEYDEWWRREGRYARGEAQRTRWRAEAAEVDAALHRFAPAGRILEFACGTGIWTEKLAPQAASLTAVDASPEAIAINAARVRSPRVHYVQADLFQWAPDGRYDTVFFGFWLSHVPPERFDAFWALVRDCLAPGGRVFFVDGQREPTSTAVDNELPAEPSTTLDRRLNDGRVFRIVKIFHEPAVLADRLRTLGWEPAVPLREGLAKTVDWFRSVRIDDYRAPTPNY